MGPVALAALSGPYRYLRFTPRCPCRASHFGDGSPMSDRPNKRDVSPRNDKWVVTTPGADRASAVLPTQAAAVARAKEILANNGGGELRVRGKNGQVREQNTVPPGNDPKRSKG
ncbi:DUF2188 domain-containing protein [Streptomyces sp. NPDC058418]|uniref:DUF2188 domain-containing protein n=1 Tax=Streptomyces sp. NPDC058418 TaxID=3346488 RepID=UPI00365D9555